LRVFFLRQYSFLILNTIGLSGHHRAVIAIHHEYNITSVTTPDIRVPDIVWRLKPVLEGSNAAIVHRFEEYPGVCEFRVHIFLNTQVPTPSFISGRHYGKTLRDLPQEIDARLSAPFVSYPAHRTSPPVPLLS
jgi:hypothetical protein